MTQATFFLTQSICIYVFVCLVIYILRSRPARSVSLPFVLIGLILIFYSSSYFLLHSTAPADEARFLILLRLRWALVTLVPALFLYLASRVHEGRVRRAAQGLTLLAFAVAAVTAAAVFFDPRLIVGWSRLAAPFDSLVRPIASLSGRGARVIWAAFSFFSVTPLLLHAALHADRPRVRSDARHMLYPWLMMGFAFILGAGGYLTLSEIGPALRLALAIASGALNLTSGVILFRAVLRFGSPVGQPAGMDMPPVATAVGILSLGSLILIAQHGDVPLLAHASLLGGALSGLAMSRAAPIARAERLLGQGRLVDSEYVRLLRGCWERLAVGDLSQEQVNSLARALREQIGAEFIEGLPSVGSAEAGRLTFRHDGHGPAVVLPAAIDRWPLTETNIDGRVEAHNLPGQLHLVLPVHHGRHLAGVVAVGEPARGGVYGPSHLLSLDLFVGLLRAAFSAGGLRPEPAAPGNLAPAMPSGVGAAVVVRAFGRLEILHPARHGRESPPLPLRARQLLACLLAAYPGGVSSEVLIERLWPDSAPARGLNNLYVAIHALRRCLEPGLARPGVSRYLQREQGLYRLTTDPDMWIDVLAFEDGYRAGSGLSKAGDSDGAIKLFQRSLSYYRGPFLGDPCLDLPAEFEAQRYHLRREWHEMTLAVIDHLARDGSREEADLLRARPLDIDAWDEPTLAKLGRIGEAACLPESPLPRRVRANQPASN